MSRTSVDRNAPPGAFDRLPLRIAQCHPSASGASRIAFVGSMVVELVVVLGGVAVATVAEPASLGVLASRPLATAQIAAGITLWAALMVIPATRLLSRAWLRQEVVVADGHVEIIRRTPLGSRRRLVPLTAYKGIAHHVRASLSGLAHEIVLVHAEPSLTVTLMSAERVTQAMLDEAKLLLGLPEIPARAIYERRSVQRAEASAPELGTVAA